MISKASSGLIPILMLEVILIIHIVANVMRFEKSTLLHPMSFVFGLKYETLKASNRRQEVTYRGHNTACKCNLLEGEHTPVVNHAHHNYYCIEQGALHNYHLYPLDNCHCGTQHSAVADVAADVGGDEAVHAAAPAAALELLGVRAQALQIFWIYVLPSPLSFMRKYLSATKQDASLPPYATQHACTRQHGGRQTWLPKNHDNIA